MPTKDKVSLVNLALDISKIKKVKHITKAQDYHEAVENALKIVIDNAIIHKTLLAVKGKGNIKDVYNRLDS